jgi:hypothetical protein
MQRLLQDLGELEFAHLSFDWPLFIRDLMNNVTGYAIAYYYEPEDPDAYRNATLALFRLGVGAVLTANAI